LKNLNKIGPPCLNSNGYNSGSDADADFFPPFFWFCDTKQTLQQWVFRKRTHICSLLPVDLCFTVSNSSLPPFNSSLSCLPYNETSTSQKWTIDAETNMIVNVDSKLCLAGKTADQYQTWAFESILFDTYSIVNPPSTKCDPKFVKDDGGINGNGGYHGHHHGNWWG